MEHQAGQADATQLSNTIRGQYEVAGDLLALRIVNIGSPMVSRSIPKGV